MAEEKKAEGLKDRDLQKYYEDLLAMYASPGWKHFTDDLAKIKEVANTLKGIESMEHLFIRKGQVDIIDKIVAQPFVTEAAYDQLLVSEAFGEPTAV